MKKLIFFALMLLNFGLFVFAGTSSAELKPLSENQDFIVSDDALNGEYVGIVKAYPEYYEIGSPPAFTLKENVNDIYAVDSSTGLISISDNRYLSAGADIITVTIGKPGHQNLDIQVEISVLDHSLCTFIDPERSIDGTGSRTDPRNRFPASDQIMDHMAILIKRGSHLVLPSMVYINNKSKVLIASYGEGALPVLSTSDGSYVFRIWSSTPDQGPEEIVIRDLACTSEETAGNYPEPDYSNWGAGLCYTSNTKTMFSILHCELFKMNNGLTINSPLAQMGDNITVKWNNLHDLAQEGIYIQNNKGSVYCEANRIVRNNLKWFFDMNEQFSQGDQIQLTDNREMIVRNNYLDKSFTGNKFNVIAQYSRREMDGTEWVDISNNYMIGNAGGDPSISDGISGALIYADFPNGVIRGNTLIASVAGRNRGISGANTDHVEVSNNIFKGLSTGVIGSNFKILHNVLYNCDRCLIGSNNEFINNIVHFSEHGQKAYANTLSIIADYNLYNLEQENMFQSGNDAGFDDLNAVRPAREASSLIGDAGFADPLTNDFRIDRTSPAYHNGTLVKVHTDFYNRTRGNKTDIGIYQVDDVGEIEPTAYNLYFTGEFSVHETIALNYSFYDANMDDEAGTRFEWYRSVYPDSARTLIPGAQDKTYQPAPADIGMYITARVIVASDKWPEQGLPQEVTSDTFVKDAALFTVTDDFDTYDADTSLSDSGNWKDLQGNIHLTDISGNIEVTAAGGNHEIAVRSESAFEDDQYAKITNTFFTRGGYAVNSGVVVRASGSGPTLNCYVLTQCNGWARLGKWVNGRYTELASPVPFSLGTIIKLQVKGNELSVWADDILDTSIGSQGIIIDNDISSGSVGIYVHGNSIYQRLDDFEGGNLDTAHDLPSPIVIDEFDSYIPGTALSDHGHWTDLQGNMQLVDTHGDIEVTASGGHDEIAVWSSDSFFNDQYAKIENAYYTRGGYYVNSGVVLRTSGSGATLNGYVLKQCNEWTRLGKWVDGHYTELAMPAPIPKGSTIELRAEGNELSIRVNGVLDTSVGNNGIIIDNSIAFGSVGIYVHGNSVYQRLDSFEGGSFFQQ